MLTPSSLEKLALPSRSKPVHNECVPSVGGLQKHLLSLHEDNYWGGGGVILPHRGYLAISGDVYDCHKLMRWGATGIYGIDIRGATKHLTTHGIVSPQKGVTQPKMLTVLRMKTPHWWTAIPPAFGDCCGLSYFVPQFHLPNLTRGDNSVCFANDHDTFASISLPLSLFFFCFQAPLGHTSRKAPCVPPLQPRLTQRHLGTQAAELCPLTPDRSGLELPHCAQQTQPD